MPVGVVHLLGFDAVLVPRAALSDEVEEQRLEPVDRCREPGFGRHSPLELVEQGPEGGTVGTRQQPVEALGGRRFLRRLGLPAGRVVEEGVIGVDLDDVVHQEKPDDLRDVDLLGRMRREHPGHHGQVPRVLGRVLESGLIGDPSPPVDRLEPVEFEHEREPVAKVCVADTVQQPVDVGHSGDRSGATG